MAREGCWLAASVPRPLPGRSRRWRAKPFREAREGFPRDVRRKGEDGSSQRESTPPDASPPSPARPSRTTLAVAALAGRRPRLRGPCRQQHRTRVAVRAPRANRKHAHLASHESVRALDPGRSRGSGVIPEHWPMRRWRSPLSAAGARGSDDPRRKPQSNEQRVRLLPHCYRRVLAAKVNAHIHRVAVVATSKAVLGER